MKKLWPLLIILSLAIAINSCTKKKVPSKPEIITQLSIVSGNNQIRAAGAFLDSLKVRVVDQNNDPVPNISVRFTPNPFTRQGGHFVGVDSASPYVNRVTNINGIAAARYYIDTVVGFDSMQALASDVDDSLVYFELSAVAGPASRMTLVSGNNQTTVAGRAVAAPIIVAVADTFGNPVAGHEVTFIAHDRSLVKTDSTDTFARERDSVWTFTGADGHAQATWITSINPVPGLGTWPNSNSIQIKRESGDTLKANIRAITTNPGTMEFYDEIRPIFERNCFICHSWPTPLANYSLSFYYDAMDGGNIVPGDTNSVLLAKAISAHNLNNINLIEEDMVIRWVMYNNAAPGSSGLTNYNDDIKSIFDAKCISCHGSSGNYSVETHAGIRGNGSDAVPNALPGDSSSTLIQRLLPGGNMRGNLSADVDSAATLADSVIRWIVVDSLREY